MKSAPIATTTLTRALRTDIAIAQRKLAIAQVEATTGRHADSGLALGRMTANVLSLGSRVADLNTAIDRNGLTSVRLSMAQDTLASLGAAANSQVSNLVNARISPQARADAIASTEGSLSAYVHQVNGTHQDMFLFAGEASNTAPLSGYADSAAKTAVDEAFATHFGFPQTSAAVSTISATDMAAFLDGPFAELFENPAWQATWSGASDRIPASRIEPGYSVEAGVSANAQAFRDLMMSYVMTGELGGDRLGAAAFDVVADRATARAASAASGFGTIQSTLGAAQGQVATASGRMERKRNLLTIELGNLQSVDRYAAATAVNELMTQLEASYRLTARIGSLSLVNLL